MSLIFDSFPDEKYARAFADSCKSRFGVNAQVFMSVEAAQEHDPIPVDLVVPIVHVNRNVVEAEIILLATTFNGIFVGT